MNRKLREKHLRIGRLFGLVFLGICFVACDGNSWLSGKSVRLFENFRRAPDYWKKVKIYKKGQKFDPPHTLLFTKRSIAVTEVVSSLFSSVIFETEDGQILRIAKSFIQRNDMKDFKLIYDALVKNNVPVVKTSADGYKQKQIEYLLHEKIDIQFSLMQLKRPSEYGIPTHEKEKIFDKFLEFAKKTSPFEFIADLHCENVVYTKDKEWIALDFGASDENKFIDYPGKQYSYFEMPVSLRKQIKRWIFDDGFSNEKIILTTKAFDSSHALSFQNLAKNTFGHPDRAVKDNPLFEMPAAWVDRINKVIAQERLNKIRSE